MDTPTTVTVLTSEFLNDVGGSRVLDATKYVAGVGEARIPGGEDRTTIRGFETGGRRVDGFNTAGRGNYDHGAIGRVEVVKGPDALLHPSGTPGGTVNLVTKKPQFTFGGSAKLQLGEYNTNRAEVDVTGPINDSFAYRAVVAYQDSTGYIDGYRRDSLLFTPSLTWRLAPQTNLTLRYEYYHFKDANIVGIPTDPSVGTRGAFKVLQGVPRNFNPTYGRDYEFDREEWNQAMLLFTSTLTDRLSVRVAGRVAEGRNPQSDLRIRMSYLLPVPAGWTPVNPLTGEYVPGVLFDPNPPYTATIPEPALDPNLGLIGTEQTTDRRYRDVQNDWSYIVEADSLKSTTLLGFAYAYSSRNSDRAQRFAPSINILTETRPSGTPVVGPINSQRRLQESRYQVYLTEQLELFDKRVVISGGVSHVTFNALSGDKLSAAKTPPNPAVAGQMFPGSGSKATYNYGVVVKPLSSLSLYYGHTENAVPVADFEQVGAGIAPTFSAGEQDEFGIKGSFLDGRIIASIAYYEISQSGYEVFNPGNFANPPPPTLLPSLYLSREARGWEYQVTGSITPSLSVIASYTDTTNRDPNGNLLGGAAEELASGYIRYEFVRGSLRGLALAVGAVYSGERAIENVAGLTPASTPANPIPIRSSGFLPAHTLVDFTLSYTRANWSYSLTVANALDKDYIAAPDARTLINVGTPRNIYGSATWKF
ncbi:hypothetical protein AXK11_00315 [Cephaloticoccus primus]|uniref:TonB-dependent receptor plug domain-containing protein n=2 Tax=Cephaloticoccus primus TaxID=1548207 RepID=A0A139ST11_9BACT|nr:hypothetical protein AXK11_00315 [Cephaloticoccus primus]